MSALIKEAAASPIHACQNRAAQIEGNTVCFPMFQSRFYSFITGHCHFLLRLCLDLCFSVFAHLIDQHCQQQGCAGDKGVPVYVNAQQVQCIGNQCHQQRTQECAQHGAFAALEAGTADDGGRNDPQLQAGALGYGNISLCFAAFLTIPITLTPQFLQQCLLPLQ